MKNTLLSLLLISTGLFAEEVPLLDHRQTMEVPDECVTSQTWSSPHHLISIKKGSETYLVDISCWLTGPYFVPEMKQYLRGGPDREGWKIGEIGDRILYTIAPDDMDPYELMDSFAEACIRTGDGMVLVVDFSFAIACDTPVDVGACRETVMGILRSIKDGPRTEELGERRVMLGGMGHNLLLTVPAGSFVHDAGALLYDDRVTQILPDGSRGWEISVGFRDLEECKKSLPGTGVSPHPIRGGLLGKPVDWVVADCSKMEWMDGYQGLQAVAFLPLAREPQKALCVDIIAPDEATLRSAIDLVATGGLTSYAAYEERRATCPDSVLEEDARSRDEFLLTPLHRAAAAGGARAVARLLEQGADANAADMFGRTPLQAAAAAGDSASVKLLLEHGASPHARNHVGGQPLANAAFCGDVESARLLSAHGADVNAIGWYGDTALHFAAQEGNTDMVKFLIGSGADVSRKEDNRWTPLHSAIRCGDEESARLLLEHGADANAKACDTEGDEPDFTTPLFMAVDEADASMVRLLLRHGADPAAPAKGGTSLIRYTRKLLEEQADDKETAEALRSILQLLGDAFGVGCRCPWHD